MPQPRPFTYTTDPSVMSVEHVKNCVTDHFLYAGLLPPTPTVLSPWTSWPYPSPSALWPNPLLHNHRLKSFGMEGGPTGEEEEATNSKRLSSLWRYSQSHGVGWDDLDRCYLYFISNKQKREKLWEAHRVQILQYASDVTQDKLIAYRKGYLKKKDVDVDEQIEDDEIRSQMLCPRSIHRTWTRKLYRRWNYNYMSPFRLRQSSLKLLSGKETIRLKALPAKTRDISSTRTTRRLSGWHCSRKWKKERNMRRKRRRTVKAELRHLRGASRKI
eukprot:GHVS01004543.1.p1 GENE.GHVS01004543.1~~GHVS01004543.1.p1  ORF type:complete len:272 (-),score=38.94 GHVS01004543.1:139-954(-)